MYQDRDSDDITDLSSSVVFIAVTLWTVTLSVSYIANVYCVTL